MIRSPGTFFGARMRARSASFELDSLLPVPKRVRRGADDVNLEVADEFTRCASTRRASH